MKASEALAAGKRLNMETDLRRAGFEGDLNDIPAVVAFLRARPMLDVEVLETTNPPLGKKILRPEQNEFRAALFHAYDGKCAVTGSTTAPVLEAAHLPGRSHELGHNQASDGILLRADSAQAYGCQAANAFPCPTKQRHCRSHSQGRHSSTIANWTGEEIRLPKRIFDRPAV